MKNKVFWIGLIALFCFLDLSAQGGSAFGIKLGPTVGFQKWNNSRDSELLFRYHGIAYIETFAPDAPYALFAQAGYHIRGGALRLRGGFFSNGGNLIPIRNRTFPYEFQNLSLALGAKQRFLGNNNNAFYWLVGARGEVTIGTNLEDYHPEGEPFNQFNSIHPFPGPGVRKINYGIIVGGGIDFMFSELVGGMLELTINPDFSSQYKAGSVDFLDNQGNLRPTGEREIRNISLELSFGIRLLRIVEYVNQVY